MAILAKSTAHNRLFLMVQSADHLTGLTGAAPACNISKNGAAFGAAAGAVTEIASGWYQVALNTTDTGTAGDLAFHITAASADPTDFVDQVVDPTVVTLGVNAVQINAVATSSVTTINANQGTTQPLNFTGTAGSALVKTDVTDIAAAAVATGSAQLGVNVVNIAGSAAALDTNNLLKVDVEDINGSATAAQNVSKANQSIGRGTCTTGGSPTSVTTSAFTPGGGGIVNGQFIGRTIVFDATTATASLQGQATNIVGNTSGATPTFTIGGLTTPPVSGDTFGVY